MMNIPTTAYRSSINIITRTSRRQQATAVSTSTASCSSSRVMATLTNRTSTSTALFPEENKTTPSKRQQHNTLRTRTSSTALQRRTGNGETWNELIDDIESPTITTRTTRDIEVLQQSLRKLGLLNEMILKPGL
mmetsp:Transcript_20118/g.22266  ORF Transcript_20118/g.22266 Transcript_20118/m.22266 type:complete len:134 (+) Transcript_20118:66-467(+)